MVTIDDISIVLSGGTGNLNPNLSLGGSPSSTPVTNNQLNNLFDDVSPDESEEGSEDYRCLYIFNDGDTPVYNIECWINSQVEGGATIEIGVKEANEIQRITISGGTPTSGIATFSYESKQFTIPAFTDLADAASALQTSLNSLVDGDGNKLLETVLVTTPSSLGAPTTIFDILFASNDGKKDHDSITYIGNTYSPSGIVVTVSTTQEGSPVNSIAPEIANEETAPENVSFSQIVETAPISIYRLLPSEGFPLWIKRTTEAGVASLANDGVVLKFRMETIEP